MTANHTRRTGATLRTLQTAAFPCRKAQFQACSREASMMAMICKRHAHLGRRPGGLAGPRRLGAGG